MSTLLIRASSLLGASVAFAWVNLTSPIGNLHSVRAQELDVQVQHLLKQPKHHSAQRLIAQVHSETAQKALSEARRLSQQAVQLYQQKRYAEAIAISEQSLTLWKQVLGPNHPHVASSLQNLAALHEAQGNPTQAAHFYQQSLQVREKVFGPQHPAVASSLHNLAFLYEVQGNYTQAQPLYQRSLQIREKVLPPNHPDIAASVINLAGLYRLQGQYSQAESLFQRGLRVLERSVGPEHPSYAISLNNLATLHRLQGHYAQAESLHQRSLETLEKIVGPEHPAVASGLNNLALLYRLQGNYAQAISLYQRSLTINEKVLGSKHPNVASSLNNLALVYQLQGRYERAEAVYLKALRLREQGLDANHPHIANSFNNLAELYRAEGRYAQAETFYQKALRISEAALGSEHPNTASSLNNLALSYQDQGRYDQAMPLFQRSLHINEQVLGASHPDVALGLGNLALLHIAQGNQTQAHQALSRAAEIEEENLDLILAAGSESRKRAYMAMLSRTTHVPISFHFSEHPNHLSAGQLAFTTVLRRKGRILTSLTDSYQTLRNRLASQQQQQLDELRTVRSRYAALVFQGPNPTAIEQHQATLTALKAQAEALENQLARQSTQFRSETQPINIAAVQKHIPQDSALVELVKYYPFNTKATRQEQKWLTPHYAAYILKAKGELQWVDLGKAPPIDQAVIQFRQALKSKSADIKTTARQLDQQLMEPIRAKLGNTRQLLLAPDSQLNLIPFAALVDEKDQYLIENYAITYLSSGRDLLTLQNIAPSQQPPLIVANPDYDRAGKSVKPAVASNRSSRDLALTFGPLPGTQEEGTQLKKLLPDATLLSDRNATENALKQAQAPNILHIATHGFFLKTDLDVAPSADNRASIGVFYKEPTTSQNYENPLLRSGLALAGANSRKSGSEDGIFTALEATGLNLYGTQLVVLSACETGLGDVANGEGVYGLRRAFVMAGAESQVLSLWQVDDTGTKDLMVSYYQRLQNKQGRSEALRQTQLEMLNDRQYQHPYYWAAFIPSGNWTPLR